MVNFPAWRIMRRTLKGSGGTSGVAKRSDARRFLRSNAENAARRTCRSHAETLRFAAFAAASVLCGIQAFITRRTVRSIRPGRGGATSITEAMRACGFSPKKGHSTESQCLAVASRSTVSSWRRYSAGRLSRTSRCITRMGSRRTIAPRTWSYGGIGILAGNAPTIFLTALPVPVASPLTKIDTT